MKRQTLAIVWIILALVGLSLWEATLSLETVVLALTLLLGMMLLILTIYLISRFNEVEAKLLGRPRLSKKPK